MKITIYTVSDCKFSQAEKEYLKAKSLAFEEKNLETNRDFLTEMLQKSNNFAGTPVTEIVKDDGTSMVIKGFTQTEFDAALGTGSVSATPAPDATQQTPPTEVPPAVESMPTPIAPNEPQMNEAASSMNVPTTDPMPAQPVEPTMPSTPEPTTPSMPSAPEPTMPTPVEPPQDTMTEAHSGMTPPPADTPVAPTMPDISAGQVLSDNLSTPVTTQSMTPGAGQTYSTEPPAPQGGPIADPTAGVSANTNLGASVEPQGMPQASVQPTTSEANPLSSVLNDLQSKANSTS